MPFLSVNGIRLYYEISGPEHPRAPDVVLLHGLGSSSADWALQVPAFTEHYLIPDSGHATPYDQPEAFNRAALDFIAAH